MSTLQTRPTPSIAGRRKRSVVAAPTARRQRTVVLIQKGEHGSAGLLRDVLAQRGLEISGVRVDLGETLPAVGTAGFAVLLGTDELTDELDPRVVGWIREADAAGVAVFAIGTGAHALALALGGASVRSARAERGWISVRSADPDLLASGPWFAWNERTLTLPAEAELLAASLSGPRPSASGVTSACSSTPRRPPS